MADLSRQEFTEQYAANSGVTVAWLRANGREAASCDCDDEGCQGWQMAHVKTLLLDEQQGILMPREAATLAEIRKYWEEEQK